MDSATVNLIGILIDRVNSLRDQGDLSEAFHASNAALDMASTHLGTDAETVDAYVTCLELRGDVQRELGYLDEARGDYREGLDLLENRPDCLDAIGRLYANIGATYDQEDAMEEARENWDKAIYYFQQSDPPLDGDIATLSNNLGCLLRQADDLVEAEGYFLQALEVAHGKLGPEDELTATICNNLGVLYLKTERYEQAREMHMMALEARKILNPGDHPDTAQSHNNLALALLYTGDHSWARRHFEKSLGILENLGAEYAEDLEAVAGNYCDYLREEGEINLADNIEARIRDLMPLSDAS